MNDWKYYNPIFECDKLNYDLLKYAPWSGHRSFVYDFMNYLRPNSVAELGSHYGCSAFTFCQAAKDFGLDTEMNFVDTWQGDDFTKKYDNDVYTVFSKIVDAFYGNQKVNMLKMTFDEAVKQFENGSIDVIHIDGSHHYDDVKKDFETWYPKVSENGVIMLHDISSDIVLGDVMGSYKYWLELQEQFKYTVSFDFSWGLGVIFLSEGIYKDFISKVDLSVYQRYNNALDVEFKDKLRQNYFEIKDKQMYIDDLLNQKKVLESHLNSYKNNMSDKEQYIEELKGQKDILMDEIEAYESDKAQMINKFESDKNETIRAYNNDKNVAIRAYEMSMQELKNNYENTVEAKDNYIKSLENELKEVRIKSEMYSEKYRATLEYKLRRLINRKEE